MAKRKNWTDTENVAVVALYRAMAARVESGEKYNKAAMIRRAQWLDPDTRECRGQLWQRSRGSIESKLMNVTAIVEQFGCGRSMANHGYRPLPNYQASLRDAVLDAVKSTTKVA